MLWCYSKILKLLWVDYVSIEQLLGLEVRLNKTKQRPYEKKDDIVMYYKTIGYTEKTNLTLLLILLQITKPRGQTECNI